MNCQHLGAIATVRLDPEEAIKLNIYILEPPESGPIFSQQAVAICLKEHKLLFLSHTGWMHYRMTDWGQVRAEM